MRFFLFGFIPMAIVTAIVTLGLIVERDWQAGGYDGIALACWYVVPAAVVGAAVSMGVLAWRRCR
jgi:hypothetical protein